ncbi:MAG: hypothetical protein ACYSR9_10150, partial [Planctomycetota bacterium]
LYKNKDFGRGSPTHLFVGLYISIFEVRLTVAVMKRVTTYGRSFSAPNRSTLAVTHFETVKHDK